MRLKAGYIIDEILDLFHDKETALDKFKQHCNFEVTGIGTELLPIDDPEPTTSVIHNIISRGIPTRASKYLTEQLLGQHLIQKDTEIKYLIDPNAITSVSTIENATSQIETLIYSLIHIAQVQKIALLLFATKNLSLEKQQITVFTTFDFANTVKLGFEDIKVWFEKLVALQESKSRFPEIVISTDKNQNFDIAICLNKTNFDDINAAIKLTIRSAIENPIVNKFITTSKIKYKSFGKSKENIDNGKFEFTSSEKEEALTYILQSIFRKKEFRAGQLAIINRVLQGKDVIGLLPTGGGKSLTYQLAGLLQPALTIIIDPINSLMRDQYEKLIENYIDATVYINSYNNEEERKENEDRLQNGEILFSFVSPERLQIQKFRNHLLNCKNNGVYFGYAVIDEAHCVSEWGHDFRQTYLRLAKNLKHYCTTYEDRDKLPDEKKHLTLFGLTATASYDVLADIQRELEMSDDAIQSLPPEQIDRKELKFNLIKISSQGGNPIHWKREKQLGIHKYPAIKRLFYKIPEILGVPNFYDFDEYQRYPNSGIVFCPTKSDTLGNGVLALRDGYQTYNELTNTWEHIRGIKELDNLKISTFFSGSDDDLAENNLVDSEAKLSFENQSKFIKNEVNLMLATKAFGMGIDKPNIRFTIHYSLPSSVESFYQEAGRAGRDRKPALCSVLYCPDDELTNTDFLNNSFKGIDRERAIINELLEEVEYEDKFFITYLTSVLNNEFNQKFSISLWEERRLYIQTRVTKWKKVDGKMKPDDPNQKKFGYISLNDLQEHPTTETEAKRVLYITTAFLKKFCPNSDYKNWLLQKQKHGIETLIKEGGSTHLVIGFTNNEVTKITKKIIEHCNIEKMEIERQLQDGSKMKVDETERFVRAAYNFCWSDCEFVEDKLPYEYQRQVKNEKQKGKLPDDFNEQLSISPLLKEELKQSFWKIRNSSDTQRAIYRLSLLGIVDDYTIDYSGKAIVIKFSGKSEKQYKANFTKYLRRYVGEDTKELWLQKVQMKKGDTLLRNYLYTLSEFVFEIIAKKRIAAINYMKELCELGVKEGDTEFRTNIIYYFTSKFARNDYLPRDTEKGKEDLETVKRYITYLKHPPDGLGGEIDNVKHLKGACARVTISSTEENNAVSLLNAFVTFVLETITATDLRENEDNENLEAARQMYLNSFRKFSKKYEYPKWAEYISFYNQQLLSINPQLKTIITPLERALIMSYQVSWLAEFNQKFIDIEL